MVLNKFVFVYSAIILFFAISMQAQYKWEIQNPRPTAIDLFSIFPNGVNKVVFGASAGNMVSTKDAGQTWQANKISETPYCVFFTNYNLDSLNSWGVSLNELYRTKDGGETWEKISPQIDLEKYRYFGVNFKDKNHGWLLVSPSPSSPDGVMSNPGYLMQTSDGGETWFRNDNSFTGSLIDVKCAGDSTIYLLALEYESLSVSKNYLYKSVNNGKKWEKYLLPFNDIKINGKMIFFDAETGWIDKYKTTDGGLNWSAKFPGTEYAKILDFTDKNNGWAIDNNSIWHTSDGGDNWNVQAELLPGSLKKIKMLNNSVGWVCGLGGTIYKTINGGKEWIQINKSPLETLWGVDFTDENNGWAVGYSGEILNTTNAGKTWNIQNSGVAEVLRSVDFIDKNTGWAVGEKNIIYTENGGEKWNKKTEYQGGFYLRIQFVNSKTGWITGKLGMILKTTDGGVTWEKQESGIKIDFWCSFFLDTLYGWAGGNGFIISTTDGGKSWGNLKILGIFTFYNIQFIDRQTGWAACSDGITFYKTTDGGNNWEFVPYENFDGKSDGFQTFHFFDKDNGFGTSFFLNYIFETTNGGNNWQYRESFPTTRINGLKFVNKKLGWGVGFWGAIVKFYKPDSVSGIIEMNNLIKPDYKAGVFPNPFNSTTRIHFTLNSDQPVSIYVYNALGQPVVAYPEKHYSKGENEIIFKADGLPSGIYFIRLVCKEYQKSIKCLLLK